jgi:hypothetical protein
MSALEERQKKTNPKLQDFDKTQISIPHTTIGKTASANVLLRP